MSEKLTALLILHEGERLTVYRCPSGKLTIGVGRNLEDLGITLAESRFLFTNDLARVSAELDAVIPWWRTLSEVRRAVLADMCFNVGLTRFRTFRKMLAALEAKNWFLAAIEMQDSKWYRDVGARAHRLCDMMATDQWPPGLQPPRMEAS